METNDYIKVFQELNIEIHDLPSNYTPDTYGAYLMLNNQSNIKISYSSATGINDSRIIRDDCVGVSLH